MSQKQQMEIRILPNGEVTIQVRCVPGAACEAVSAGLERSLGAVKDRQRTAEYYEAETSDTVTVGRS